MEASIPCMMHGIFILCIFMAITFMSERNHSFTRISRFKKTLVLYIHSRGYAHCFGNRQFNDKRFYELLTRKNSRNSGGYHEISASFEQNSTGYPRVMPGETFQEISGLFTFWRLVMIFALIPAFLLSPYTHSHNPLTFDACCRYKSKTPVVPLNLQLYH